MGDYQRAKNEGYSDQEITDYLGGYRGVIGDNIQNILGVEGIGGVPQGPTSLAAADPFYGSYFNYTGAGNVSDPRAYMMPEDFPSAGAAYGTPIPRVDRPNPGESFMYGSPEDEMSERDRMATAANDMLLRILGDVYNI